MQACQVKYSWRCCSQRGEVRAAAQADLYSTAKELFYYAQLRSQGEHTTRSRCLGRFVPIRELPNLLCALGEAPTQLELNNVFSECSGTEGGMHRQAAACESGADQGKASTSGRIAFERFFELYLNQRAVKSFQYADVVDAFRVLSKGAEDGELTPEALTKLLHTVRPLTAL